MLPDPQRYSEANPALPSTPLDPHETSVDFTPEPEHPIYVGPAEDSIPVTLRCGSLSLDLRRDAMLTATGFRHSGWAPVRRRVYDAMHACLVPQKRLDRFAACGERAFVIHRHDSPRLFSICGNYCRDRFCTPCTNARSRFIADKLQAHLTTGRLRFITLTIKTGDQPLSVYLDKLRTSFRKLRATKLWQQRVTGGISMLEVKWNQDTMRWHPHLHILQTGSFLPVKALRAVWLKATGDSYIVDVQCVNEPTAAIAYVVKYATKAVDNSTVSNPDRLQEAIIAMSSRRTLLLLGTWRKISLKQERLSVAWDYVVSLTHLLNLARQGNDYAISVLHSLNTRTRLDDSLPLPKSCTPTRDPPPAISVNPRHPQRQPVLFAVAPTGF